MADTTSGSPVAQAVQTAEVTALVQAPQAPPANNEAQKAFEMKERQLHKLRMQIKAEKEAIERERQAMKAKAEQYETNYVPKQRLLDDTYGTLNELGLSWEKLTELALQTPNDPVTRTLMNKVNQLQQRQVELEQQRKEAEAANREQAVNQIRADAKMLIAADDRFETIKAKGLEEAVVELITATYDQKGVLMDMSEAAQKVEDYLIEEGMSFAQLKKVQSKLAPKVPEVTGPSIPKKQSQPHYTTKPQTLTNAITATPTRKLSERERIERAKAAFYGQKLG